jgi:hypothetical protein
VRESLAVIPLWAMTTAVVVVVSIVPMISSLMKEWLQEGYSLCIFLREARYLK